MSSLSVASPFGDLTVPGRFGKPGDGPAPVTVCERLDLQFYTLSVNAGRDAGVAEAVLSTTGLTLPSGPKAASKDGLAFIGTAPGQWLVAVQGEGRAQFDALRAPLAATATIVEQTDDCPPAQRFRQATEPNMTHESRACDVLQTAR